MFGFLRISIVVGMVLGGFAVATRAGIEERPIALARSVGSATWSGDPTVNLAVSTAPLNQFRPRSCADGASGAIVTWLDYRSGEYDIYAQKIDADGVPQWALNGVVVCKAPGFQHNPELVSDGFGGAIVTWHDSRNGQADIYAQRIGASGAIVWTANGVVLCAAAGDQLNPTIVSDGSGGAIVAWQDARGGGSDIYAQRVGATGVTGWAANGVALCAAGNVQDQPAMTLVASDAVVAWRDFRGGDPDIYSQRVSASGVPAWTVDGVAVCAAADSQAQPGLVPDLAGGAIVGWQDRRNGSHYDVYAQRIGPAGVSQWTADGVALCTALGHQQSPSLVSDGSGGAVLTWEDHRGGTSSDIYARRISTAGAPQWTADGVALCTAPGHQELPKMVSDGSGGAVVSWQDLRGGVHYDIYARRIDAAGMPQWTADGVALSTASDHQQQPCLVSHGTGGALVAWQDSRSGPDLDLYAQRVDGAGQIGDACPVPVALGSGAAQTVSSPLGYYSFDQIEPYWTAVGVRGTAGDWDIEAYASTGGSWPVCFADPEAGSFQTGGVDLVVGDFNHNPDDIYYVRTQRYSGSGTAVIEWDDGDDFMLPDDPFANRTTDASDVLEIWDLFLPAGQSYTLQLVPTGAADLKLLLFGGAGPYWAGRGERLVETTSQTVFTPTVSDWYGLVVVNDNGASGSYSVGAVSGIAIGVFEPPGPLRNGIRFVAPNPGRGRVHIHFTLAERCDASFRILDVAGRVVSETPPRVWDRGRSSVDWDGRGPGGRALAPGMYVVEMRVRGRSVGSARLALIR